jgi:F-type H+-transporting ATPase subunit beta
VDLPTTINSFKRIAAGEFDHLPEQAFYMVGPLAEVEEKAQRILKENADRAAREKEEEAAKKAKASA